MINPFAKGDLVRTSKGAHFRGCVVAVFDTLHGVPHVVVEAIDPGFEYSLHVYPSGQMVSDRDRPFGADGIDGLEARL